ncbi:YHS domain-containing protein [Sinomonas mesophila]|uniref:YHS domain-containing protein n=1 Tax=Sinomonas mesophila TaxID=1531955 RepID=UPI001FE406E8|nr:YHS domain-containing protein [Sinomonas mesophila]
MSEAHNHEAAPVQEHSHSHSHSEHAGEGHSHRVAMADEATGECPVMLGNYVDKEDAEAQGLVRDYEGNRYYLCCAACGPLFDADPEKYLAAL